ncbi:extracellular ligand-binding receptor [Nitratireductor indicus C115]|uniref:Extracellular ligand-binding receptor n=1 Tax=Nitratireductor indicus C115 TaxID=1231190 RepID=K2P616_9HYPH|nr:branched-chain amino acid ABC transporter substrate-binding protein [Nitratireductor indicus]EKF42771.1 extracellular ligand-binding receptor [Nitratireductor indicus C115]SFQ39977.1 branched-chain amino acid transport system substrate-binding protein [Nitratireductor indicus]
MRCLALPLVFLLAAATPSNAEDFRIGVAAPFSGSFSILGSQIRDGARVALAQDNDAVELFEQDTACSPEGGAAAARALIADRVSVVVGFICTEAVEAALPLLTEAGIPTITPGVRTATLTDGRERSGFLVYRTAPRADAERDAVARILSERWRKEFFAIVDDGTIYGRELAESLRASAELRKLEPVFKDTFRPQLDNQVGLAGRLKRAGATHVFVGGDRSDIAILARDAKGMDYVLTIAGGEALRAENSTVPLAEGTLMVGLPRWADIASPQALQALKAAEILPDGYVLPAYAAAQTALAASEKGDVNAALAKERFETVLGPFAFDGKGDLDTSFYRLFRFDGEDFREVE